MDTSSISRTVNRIHRALSQKKRLADNARDTWAAIKALANRVYALESEGMTDQEFLDRAALNVIKNFASIPWVKKKDAEGNETDTYFYGHSQVDPAPAARSAYLFADALLVERKCRRVK